MKKSSVYKLVLTGLLVAIGVLLPSIFHAAAINGSMFLPMHIPVLLCGILCGWKWGMVSGAIIPLLCSLILGMPPIYPAGVSMIAELITYGLVCGVLSQKKANIFVSLIVAMIAGRIVMGVANLLLYKAYAWPEFLGAAFVTAAPGIIIQLILIPAIFYALKKANLLERLND